MKIQKKFTTAARGMMAMKKDVAKDVMANLAENGTMFDKDKGKVKGPKKGAKGMRYNEAKEGMRVQYKMMSNGGKNTIGKNEDYTLMYKVDDQKMSGGREIPETAVTSEEIKNLFQRNKIFPSEERYFQSQLKELGISEPIKNLVTSGRLESEIKKAKEALAEKKSKDFKKEMMEQVNQPSQDRLKSGDKGMTYKKGPGGMMISFVRKNK